MTPIHLEPLDLIVAAGFVLVSAAVSLVMRFGVHRQIVWAALRMVVQLLLVGLVLRLVFAHGSAAATLGIVVLMIMAAAREVVTRPCTTRSRRTCFSRSMWRT